MAKVSQQGSALARVYAGAMIKLAESSGEVDVLLEELRNVSEVVDSDAGLEDFLTSPMVDMEARCKTIEKLCRGRYSDLFVDSLQVLNRKGRLGLIRSVTEEYARARDELQGRAKVHVRTAAPLTDAFRMRLKDFASKQTGKKIDLIETIDESLIGGLILQIGDEKFDASVATKLRTLGGALRQRASREIHSGRRHVEGAAV